MKKTISFIIAFGILSLFASCKESLNTSTSESESTSVIPPESSSIIGSSNNSSNSKNAIVVYFSATNNTKNVALNISSYLNLPIYELEPVNPYTSSDLNYSNQNSRVVKEHNDSNRHVELQTVSFEGYDEADYVFLGAPVWWQELSWVVDDFLKLNDFTGKTIVPFATSSSSGFSTRRYEALAFGATWMQGQRFSSRATSSQIETWIDGLNLNIK